MTWSHLKRAEEGVVVVAVTLTFAIVIHWLVVGFAWGTALTLIGVAFSALSVLISARERRRRERRTGASADRH
ncbi:hypothetical protein GCM10028777_02180 [Angustibacter speluncae]